MYAYMYIQYTLNKYKLVYEKKRYVPHFFLKKVLGFQEIYASAGL